MEPDRPVKIIRGERIIDGLGGPAHINSVLVLDGARVKGIFPSGEVPIPEGGQAETYNYPGGTVLPGLIDCHTHTNMPGDGRTGEDVDSDGDEVRLSRAHRNALKALETGVTSLCDNGGWNQVSSTLKKEIQQGETPGPRVLVCGRPITKTRGHCWFMGGEADGVDGIRQAARRLINEGAEFLKAMTTGGSTLGTNPYAPAFSQEELRAIVEEAHRQNKFTVGHARCTQGIDMAVDAGFDMIAHCVFAEPDGSLLFDPRVAERLSEKGVWVNPTLHIGRGRLWNLKAKAERERLTKEEEAQVIKLEQNYLQRLDQYNRLIQMGAKLVAGSDCGWGFYPFGYFAHEIESLAEAGLTTMMAILSATSEAAKALGISDQVGSLASGKQADILVVQGDPTHDLSVLGRVLAVFKDGRCIPSQQPA